MAEIDRVRFTRGLIEVIAPDGSVVSRHSQEKEAQESAINAAIRSGSELPYVIRTPDQRVEVSYLQLAGAGQVSGSSFNSGDLLFWDPQDYSFAASDTDWVTTIQNAGAPWTSGDSGNNDIGSYPPTGGAGGDPGAVFFYTVTSDFNSGSIPGTNGRGLAVEGWPNPDHPTSPQSDGDLTWGENTEGQVPGDVWFQMWLFVDDDPSWENNFSTPKFIYPSKGASGTASNIDEQDWLAFLGVNSYLPSLTTTSGGNTFFFAYNTAHGGGGQISYGESGDGACFQADDFWKMGHVTSGSPILPGTWYSIRFHANTSSAAVAAGRQLWEFYIREYGTSDYTLISRWQQGQTYQPGDPGHACTLDWTISAVNGYGHKRFKFPTTMSDTNGTENPWRFIISDWAMATGTDDGGSGESVLPGYSHYGY